MTQETRNKILMLRAQREPHKVICNETGVSHRTVLRVLADNRTQFVMHQADCTDKTFYKFGMEEEIQTEFLAMNLAKAEESLAKRNYDSIPTDKLQRIVDKLRADARKLFEKKENDLEKCLEREDQIDERRKKEQKEQQEEQAQEGAAEEQEEQNNEEKSKNEIPVSKGDEKDRKNKENQLDLRKANPVSETPEPKVKSERKIDEEPTPPPIPSSPLQEPTPTNTAQIIPMPAPTQDTSLDHQSTPKSECELQAEQENQERAGRAYRSVARHQNAQFQPQKRRMA